MKCCCVDIPNGFCFFDMITFIQIGLKKMRSSLYMIFVSIFKTFGVGIRIFWD